MGKLVSGGLRLKDLAQGERPQERLERYGPEALSDTELLAMMLRSGTRNRDVLSLSADVLRAAGGLSGLMGLSREDLLELDGIGRVKALQIQTVTELTRRILRSDSLEREPVLDEPGQVYRHFRPLMHGWEVEKFYVCALNRRNRLIREILVTSGTATSSLVHPREVFREAIRCGATAVVAAHNHPSGDPSPSPADIQVTRQLKQAAQVLDIQLLDHLIVGNPDNDPRGLGYYSFSEAGLI